MPSYHLMRRKYLPFQYISTLKKHAKSNLAYIEQHHALPWRKPSNYRLNGQFIWIYRICKNFGFVAGNVYYNSFDMNSKRRGYVAFVILSNRLQYYIPDIYNHIPSYLRSGASWSNDRDFVCQSIKYWPCVICS